MASCSQWELWTMVAGPLSSSLTLPGSHGGSSQRRKKPVSTKKIIMLLTALTFHPMVSYWFHPVLPCTATTSAFGMRRRVLREVGSTHIGILKKITLRSKNRQKEPG